MSCNQPNKLFHHKTNMATLFSCHTEGTQDHYLHFANYLKKEPIYSVFKDKIVILNLKTSNWMNYMQTFVCTKILTLALFLNDKFNQGNISC